MKNVTSNSQVIICGWSWKIPSHVLCHSIIIRYLFDAHSILFLNNYFIYTLTCTISHSPRYLIVWDRTISTVIFVTTFHFTPDSKLCFSEANSRLKCSFITFHAFYTRQEHLFKGHWSRKLRQTQGLITN